MKYIWKILLLTSLVLTACGPAAEPTMNPADVQGTAMAAALTMVAETQAAIPSVTPIPPTEAPSATPFPTSTLGIGTLAIGTVLSPTLPVGALPTNTTAPVTNTDCNKPLTTWEVPSAKLTLRNNTKPKGTVTASLYFTTAFEECGYIGAQFSNSTTLTVPTGTMWAGAFVDGPKDFKIFGGGTVTEGSWSLWFENDSIILKAGCSPNC